MSPSGFRLEDQYRIVRSLGRGGFGEVFLAEQLSLGRRVVIKTIRSGLAGDADARARFRKEALLIAGLRHPNIVTYHDFHEDERGTLYIVMEYLQGASLAEYLHSKRQLAPDAAVRILTGLCRALEAIHAVGIVHRDLKPSNVLLVGDGPDLRPVLIDFGLLKHLGGEALTRVGTMLGTPTYMAPEQIRGKTVGPESDLYALGVMAYEMLTGGNPFRTPDLKETVFRQLHLTPRPLEAMDLPTPPSRPLSELVSRLLAKDPAVRPSSASQVRHDLQRSLTLGERASAALERLPGGSSPALRWVMAAGLLLVLGILGGVLTGRLLRQAHHHPGIQAQADPRSASKATRLAPLPRRTPPPGQEPARRPARPPEKGPAAPATAASSALPPAVRAEVGYITINARPFGTVWLDNVNLGTTPIMRRPVAAGQHLVVIRLKEKGLWRRHVTVKPNDLTVVTADFEKKQAR